MTKNERPNISGQFSAELKAEISRLLRQGRHMKKLSLAQAAKELEMSPFLLKALEEGTINQSTKLVNKVLAFYGFDELNFFYLCQDLMNDRALQDSEIKKREHLSVVGENPKPWESPPDSLASSRKRGSERCKR